MWPFSRLIRRGIPHAPSNGASRERLAARSQLRRRRRLALEAMEERRLLAVADVFESDNTPAEAKEIVVNGASQTHSIHNSGADVDWIRFTLTDTKDLVVQTTSNSGFVQVMLFRASNPNDSLSESDSQTGLLRHYEASPGDYLLRVASFGSDVDAYTTEVRGATPVAPLARIDYVSLAGEGFNSVQFTPDGRLAQLLWYGETLTYRIRAATGSTFVEENVTTSQSQSFGPFSPRKFEQAQLLFAPDATPHALVSRGGSVDHFVRESNGWAKRETIPLGLPNFASVVHFVADIGRNGALHFIATVDDDVDGSLWYGTDKSGSWVVQQALDRAETTTRGFAAAGHLRYVDLAVDSNNAAHVVYTPRFEDFGTGGFSRPFNQLAYATNAGGSWTTQVVHQPPDDSGESGIGGSIAIAPNGQPAIAHFFIDRVSTGSASFGHLLFHQRQANGTWTNETVATSPDGYVAGDGARFTGFSPQLLYDADGSPHITFTDYASQHFPQFGADEFAGQIRHAVREGAGWRLETVLPQTDPLRNFMFYPSMAVGSTSVVYVGIRRFDFLRSDNTVIRSEHFFATASTPRTGLALQAASL